MKGLFYLQKNTIQDTIQDTSQDTIYKEGFSAPTRYIDSDLQDYLKMSNMHVCSQFLINCSTLSDVTNHQLS